MSALNNRRLIAVNEATYTYLRLLIRSENVTDYFLIIAV